MFGRFLTIQKMGYDFLKIFEITILPAPSKLSCDTPEQYSSSDLNIVSKTVILGKTSEHKKSHCEDLDLM